MSSLWLAAACTALACGAASAQSSSFGLGRTFDGGASRSSAAPMQLESAPAMVEVEKGAQSFYFTAPYRQKLAERTPFTNQQVVTNVAGQSAAQIYPADLSIGWRYRSSFERDPALTVSYNAQTTFDAGESDAIAARGTREYLARVEIARDLGPIMPRAEIGYRYFPRSAFDAQSGRSLFGAAGLSYRFSTRSAMDLYFDYETAPAAGLAAQRSVSLDFSHRVTSGSDVSIYAFRSLTEDKAYNAGVRLTVQF